MVMHARKLPRLSDGYYERHQGHSYQHQNSRYNSSSRGSSSNRYNHDRTRNSPNGRLDSPEDRSPVRNRTYANKSSYSQRIYENDRDRHDRERDNTRYDRERDRSSRYDRYNDKEKDINNRYEKERYEKDRDCKFENSGRDRDSKYDNNRDKQSRYDKEKDIKYEKSERNSRYHNSKERYSSDRSPSPKDRSYMNRDGKDTSYQSNNDRSNNEKYSNKVWNLSTPTNSAVSLTETPPSISTPPKLNISVPVAPPLPVATPPVSTSTPPVNIVNTPPIHNIITPSIHAQGSSIPQQVTHSVNINSSTNPVNNSKDSAPKKEPVKEKRDENNRLIRLGEWSEHFSSIGRYYYYNCRTEVSTWDKPREWLEREAMVTPNVSLKLNSTTLPATKREMHSSQDMEICSGSSTPTSAEACNVNVDRDAKDIIRVRISELSNMTSALPVTTASYTTISASTNQTIKIEHSSSASSSSSVPSNSCNNRRLSLTTGPSVDIKMESTDSVDPGPPTPTHSENHDIGDNHKCSPQSSNISSLQNISASAGTASGTTNQTIPCPGIPQLTPSLSQYVRDDLTLHVRNWGIDNIEKQAMKFKEDRNMVSHLQLGKVSAELKSARSRVRINEIMSTLCEQRLLVAQEKLKVLDNMKSQVMYPVAHENPS